MSKPDSIQFSELASINAGFPRYVEYLQVLRADAVAFLVQSMDPVIIHRAQGKIAFIDEHIAILANAHKYLAKKS